MSAAHPIIPVAREHVEDLSSLIQPLWELDTLPPLGMAGLPWLALQGLQPGQWQAPLLGSTSFMVVCTSRRAHLVDDFITWATGLPDTRTYLVGPEDWAGSLSGQALLKHGNPRLLVRLGAEPPGDWILADQGRAGWLMVGPPGGARSWVIQLDASLARSLFEASTHLFWHHTAREAVPDTQGPARFAACLPSPYPRSGAPRIALSSGELWLDAGSDAPLLSDAELVVEPGPARDDGAPRLLVTPPAPEAFGRVEALASQGTQVVWFDQQLPRLALTNQRMVLALEEGPLRLHLRFGAKDALRTRQALERWASQGAWRFHPRRAFRDVRGLVRTAGSPMERQVHDEVPLQLGDLTANELASFNEVRPSSWPPAPELARQVRYHWRVLPPRAPRGHRPAQLCLQWSALDEFVSRRVEQLRARLDKVEQDEKAEGLLARLAGLVARWGEVRSRRSKLRRELDEIAEQPLSKRPIEEAPALLARLLTQEEVLSGLEAECRKQVADEERRVEEERQRQLHDEGVAQAKDRYAQLQQQREVLSGALEAGRVTLDGLKADRERLIEELERARHAEEVNQSKARLTELEVLIVQEREKVAGLQEQFAKAGEEASKEARKGWKRDLHASEEKLKRLGSEADGLRRRIEAPFAREARRAGQLSDSRLDELAASQKRFGEEQAERERRAAELDKAMAECSLVIEKPFQFLFTPRAIPAAWKAASSKPPAIPNEALPEVGSLVEHDGRRYLAVSNWVQAERARPVALRLKAQLVAADPAV